MELLYLWVRDYKNIKHQGFNLSSKITFTTTIEKEDSDGNIHISLESTKNDEIIKFFPSNIVDVKVVIGENGVGKTNLIFSLLEIFLDKKNKLNGFLITTENVVVRDKIIFTSAPLELFNKSIKQINPEDIRNFDNNPLKKSFTRDQVFNTYGYSLMETYFKKEYVIYYSPFINTDNVHNIDGIANDYARWENENLNFINISSESILISDYHSLNNNDQYLITGESELLAYKYEESKRMLDFLKIANDFNFEIKFPVRSIGIEFSGFGDRFWKSIDKIISKNSSSFDQTIEKILRSDLHPAEGSEEEFFKDLSKSITYCFLSFELKNYFNFSREEQTPILRLVNNLKENYNPDLGPFEALFEYLKRTSIYSGKEDFIISQLKEIKKYFIDKFKSKEIICDGIYGFVIPSENINNIIGDFLKSPLRSINVVEDQYIVLNLFGFNFNGLSSGERGFLSLFSRINYYKKSHIKDNKNILLVIDEGEIGFHPQWQKKYLNILLDFIEKYFPNNRVQLLISTHSPFIVSDLPKGNIIFLKKDKNNMTSISNSIDHNLTFGANIHNLLANDFFLQDGFIGDFAKNKIGITLNWLKIKANEFNKAKNIMSSDFIIDPYIKVLEFDNNEEEFKYHKQIIELIGEPLVKNKLLNMFADYVNDDSNFLKDELEKARAKVSELEKKNKAMISIYKKNITEDLCNDFSKGFITENGEEISGMFKWIKARIKKHLINDFDKSRNIKYSKEINSFKALLTDDKIKIILTSKPLELIDLWNKDFIGFKDSKIRVIDNKKTKTYKNINLISLIFNYSSFRSTTGKKKFSGFLLAKKLGIECCPYCNRNYTTTHSTYKDKTVFPEYDHFYHKSSYPLFAVSFYNLIPSCNVCNTHFKGSKDAINENLLHPYTELSPNAFNFKFIPDNVESLYGSKDNFKLAFEIKDATNKTSLENSIEFFGIKEIYEQCHSDLIKEIINKKLTYSKKYLEVIKDTYGISIEESYRILFETYYEDDKLYGRPFSKLKKDIFDDINIS